MRILMSVALMVTLCSLYPVSTIDRYESITCNSEMLAQTVIGDWKCSYYVPDSEFPDGRYVFVTLIEDGERMNKYSFRGIDKSTATGIWSICNSPDCTPKNSNPETFYLVITPLELKNKTGYKCLRVFCPVQGKTLITFKDQNESFKKYTFRKNRQPEKH